MVTDFTYFSVNFPRLAISQEFAVIFCERPFSPSSDPPRTGALPPEGLITGRAMPTALMAAQMSVEDQGSRKPSASPPRAIYGCSFQVRRSLGPENPASS